MWKFINTFHEGLVIVIDENDLYGFADENEQIVFSPQWDYAHYFEKGYAYVRKGEDRFYIDHDGNMLPIRHDGSTKMSSDKGLDFLQRMYFKAVYPVDVALLDNVRRKRGV